MRATFSPIALIFAAALAAPHALALSGHENGNGGGGTVCGKGDARQVEVLDLWEGEALKSLQILRTNDPIQAQIDRAVKALDDAGLTDMSGQVRSDVRDIYSAVIDQSRGRLKPGIAIAPPSDALNRFLPRGCHLEGIALYNDRFGTLDFDGELFDRLSPTSKAALLMHEAVYKYLREKFAVEDSTVARDLVACAFAATPCAELAPAYGLPKTGPVYHCYLKDDPAVGSPTFWLYPVDLGGRAPANAGLWRFQVEALGIRQPPGRAYFDAQVTAFSVDGDGTLHGDLTDDSQDFMTRSSEDRWQDIGLMLEFVLTPTGLEQVAVNGHALACQAVSR